MRKTYFENLDALRFVAFFAIFMSHGIFSESNEVSSSVIFRLIEFIKKPTWLGVPFFFCLSGFLITYLLLVEYERFGKFDIRKFYIRRILRIWPLYYAIVLFGFFLFPIVRSFIIEVPYEETATFWKYLLFLSNFDQLQNGLPYGVGLGVTWSLSVEEQFYLFWPVIMLVVPRKFFAPLTIGIFLTSHMLMYFGAVNYHHTLGSMADLSIGAFVAVMSFEKSRLYYKLKSLSKPVIGIIYVLGITHIYLLNQANSLHILTSLFMAFVVFEQNYSPNSVIKMGRFKTISKLGIYTYGFYLLHTICNFISFNFISMFEAMSLTPALRDLMIRPLLSLSLTVFIGYLSYTYFEGYFLKLKKKFSKINRENITKT